MQEESEHDNTPERNMAKPIFTKVNVLPSGAVSVGYAAGRVYGAVMFDMFGRYEDATRCTLSTKGRGFCEQNELPAGVYAAAKAARSAAL